MPISYSFYAETNLLVYIIYNCRVSVERGCSHHQQSLSPPLHPSNYFCPIFPFLLSNCWKNVKNNLSDGSLKLFALKYLPHGFEKRARILIKIWEILLAEARTTCLGTFGLIGAQVTGKKLKILSKTRLETYFRYISKTNQNLWGWSECLHNNLDLDVSLTVLKLTAVKCLFCSFQEHENWLKSLRFFKISCSSPVNNLKPFWSYLDVVHYKNTFV